MSFLSHRISKGNNPSRLRLFIASHEVAMGLCSAFVVLLAAWLDSELALYCCWITLFLIAKEIHPAAIGFSAAPAHFPLYSSMLRGFIIGYGYGYITLDHAIIQSLFSPAMLLPFIVGEVYWRGYFLEFMKRRGFSLWIGLVCTAFLSTLFYALMFDRAELNPLLLSMIFLIALFAGTIRNNTRNVWDAVIVHMAYYCIYLQADLCARFLFSLFS